MFLSETIKKISVTLQKSFEKFVTINFFLKNIYINFKLKIIIFINIKEIMENQKTQKNPEKYFCEKCDFNTSHKNDYNKHLLTSKHQNWVFGNDMEIFGNKKTQKNPDKYCCEK